MPGGRRRFDALDAFRGVAALAVLGFHVINNLVPRGTNAAADVLWLGWTGVYLFFPISGYCVLAASHSAGITPVRFLTRRWARIFPTYWASLIVVVVLTLVFARWSRGSAAELWTLGWGWLPVLTLTQTLFGLGDVVNSVYWSLCYEEQFYIVTAATMLAPAHARRWLLFGLTAGVATIALCGLLPYVPRGLFVDRWMCFAAGLAVFGWFDPRYGRPWAMAILALAATGLWTSGLVEMSVALGGAVSFIALWPFDTRVSSLRPVRWLGAVGAFSYSVYLTHVPVAGRVVNLSKRFALDPATWTIVAILASAVSLVCARLFFLVVERRYVRLPSASPLTVQAVGPAPSSITA